MQVNRINNQQPSFGMKYVQPRQWNPQILETLMDSPLVKEIDSKYPKAKAKFSSDFPTPGDMSLHISLDKNQDIAIFKQMTSIQECCNKILSTKFSVIERDLSLEVQKKANDERIFARAEANNAKAEALSAEERTPFQKFICKLFGIK